MPLRTAPLERAGIHVTRQAPEALVNRALEQALPPYGVVDSRQNLPAAELIFFQGAGVELDEFAPLDAGIDAPELRTAAKYAGVLASALTVSQAAARLAVDSSRLRQRLADHTLYGVRVEASWRLPLFQFTDDGRQVVPGFGEFVPLLLGLHPVDVATWFLTPHVDLVVGKDQHVSPRDWLLGGGESRPLLPLTQELAGIT